MKQEIGGEGPHHVERAVGEIDDRQHAENDREPEAQQRIERAVDEADQQLAIELRHADRVAEHVHGRTPSFDRRHHTPSASCRLSILPLQLRAGEGVDDPAVLHDKKTVGQGRGEAEILLDQQNREPLPLELGDGAADLLDDDRREALGRFVEHQKSRAGPQDARNGQHLLLAAGQLAAAARQPLAQVGKEREDALHAHRARLGDRRRQKQILLDRERGEYGPLLGTERDAMPGDAVDREADELLAVEHDRTHSLADDAHDRLQRRRLAGSVSSEQRHDLALPHVEIDAVQNVRFVVPGLQALDAEHRRSARGRRLGDSRLSHAPPRDRPASPLRSPTPRDSRPRPARGRASAR